MRLLSFLNETNILDVNDFTLVEMRLLELRNVLNTDEITDWSNNQARSVATRITDEPEVQASIYNWLSKSLRKYILTNVRGEKVDVLVGGDKYATRNKSGPISELPPWAQKSLLSGDELEFIDPSSTTPERNVPKELNLVRDWLRYKLRTNPEQLTQNRLSRISFENALKLSDDYHQELERNRPATESEVMKWYLGDDAGEVQRWSEMNPVEKQKVYSEFTKVTGRKVAGIEDTPEHHKLVKEYGSGTKWVTLSTQSCLDYEGNMMGHCVADYGKDVESGYVDIISLRDNKNEPHVTIEVANESGTVSQIKGKGNESPVVKYIPYVIDMLNILYDKYESIQFSDEGEEDLIGMGMFRENTTYGDTIKMIVPPFAEPDKFTSSFTYKDEERDIQEETYDGTIEDILSALSDEYFSSITVADASYVLNTIIRNDEFSQDDSFSEGEVSIWYNGKDKDERRTLRTVVPG